MLALECFIDACMCLEVSGSSSEKSQVKVGVLLSGVA